MAQPIVHHRGPDFRIVYERCLSRAEGRLPHRERGPAVHVERHRDDGIGGLEPLLAGRARLRRVGRLVRRALVGDRGGVRLRGRPARVRVGRDPLRGRSRGAARRARVARRAADALRDVHRCRRRRARAHCCRQGGGRAVGRRRDLEPRRGSARDRRVGCGRRHLGLAEGADDAARARARLRVAGRLGLARDAAALLLRLGADAQGAGRLRRGVHAGRVARRGAGRRARHPAGEGPRRGVRASRSPRPRVSRGDQGNGSRALLAGRRHRRRRYRRARRRRESTRASCCSSCATATASRSRRARAR